MSELTFDLTDKTITDLINLQENGQLNLNPSFQRDSVWKPLHRRRFIHTILDRYPVPSIFLYLDDTGTYQVLDGKQPLETIFKFAKVSGVRREDLAVKYRLTEEEQERWLDWRALSRAGRAPAFRSYRMQVVEVRGELSDIVELFVLINSTGTALTRAEVRHAKFYKKDFMRQAHKAGEQLPSIPRGGTYCLASTSHPHEGCRVGQRTARLLGQRRLDQQEGRCG